MMMHYETLTAFPVELKAGDVLVVGGETLPPLVAPRVVLETRDRLDALVALLQQRKDSPSDD